MNYGGLGFFIGRAIWYIMDFENRFPIVKQQPFSVSLQNATESDEYNRNVHCYREQVNEIHFLY